MNKAAVIRMARVAGALNCDCCLPFWPEEDLKNWKRFFVNFATIVEAAAKAEEREACAKVCEEVERRADELWGKFAIPEDQGMTLGAGQCAEAIRARGEKK